MKYDVLVIDDKVRLCTSLLTSFSDRGYSGIYATNRKDAFSKIATNKIGVVVLDVKLGTENGLVILSDILKLKLNIPVIMITGFATIDMAVEALKAGAIDFIQKPVLFTKLLDSFKNAMSMKLMTEKIHTEELENPTIGDEHFVAEDPRMVRLLMEASNLAQSDLPVLILGESGTGKEYIANFIHTMSKRIRKPLVKINCAVFPESLLDNELFGHEKGAFTDARERFSGVFERANGGSLFLDELGDMSLHLQPKVLRVLQNKEIRRLGGKQDLTVDVRFIASTNKDIQELISQKIFREDLYYRLNAAQLYVPPLRERRSDIPLLTKYFLHQAELKNGSHRDFEPEVLKVIESYDWPGNVRELQNVVRYSVAIASGDNISLLDLPRYLRPDSLTENESMDSFSLQNNEKRIIEDALRKVLFNKKKAAELLNISRVTLYKKIEKYRIS